MNEDQIEQEQIKVPTVEELRAHVIAEYGFDESIDAERIEKAIAKETKNRTLLSGAIGAKVKMRSENEELKKKIPQPESKDKKEDTTLSMSDQRLLIKADVPEEDVQEILDFAKLKGITISEAMKLPIITGILREKAETRRTALATQTRSTRSTTKVSGSEIVEKIKAEGENAIPDAGSEEAMALFRSRNPRFKD